MDGWLATHEVEGTLTGRKYRLVRSSAATRESAKELLDKFREFEWENGQNLEYEEWQIRDAQYAIPSSVETVVVAQTRLKGLLDKWLTENAGKYGYVYYSE